MIVTKLASLAHSLPFSNTPTTMLVLFSYSAVVSLKVPLFSLCRWRLIGQVSILAALMLDDQTIQNI